jgi:hypothetical protein
MRSGRQPKWKVLSKRRARERKRRWILNYFGGKCSNCGQTDPDLLHFHHPNHDRSYRRGLASQSWAFIYSEVRRGTLLCKMCNGAEGAYYGHNGRK